MVACRGLNRIGVTLQQLFSFSIASIDVTLRPSRYMLLIQDSHRETEMLDWLLKNWGWLMLALAGAAYFCVYVMLARERSTSPQARRRLEKDC